MKAAANNFKRVIGNFINQAMFAINALRPYTAESLMIVTGYS